MTEDSIEVCLTLVERYLDASCGTSNELAFMALRSAVVELVTAIRLLRLSTQSTNEEGKE